MNEHKKFFKSTVEGAVKVSKSYLETARKLGTSRQTATRLIGRYGVDISHFKGARDRFTAAKDMLKAGIKRSHNAVKSCVLRENLLEYICCECDIEPHWNGKKLVLELDHINGDSVDNRLENLRFLCPNCHSQTETNRGRNIVLKRLRGF